MIGVQLKEQRFAVKISKQDYQYYITSNSLGSSRRLPGISLCSNKYKTKNLDVLNTCSSVNRVVLIEAHFSVEMRKGTCIQSYDVEICPSTLLLRRQLVHQKVRQP